MLQLLVIGCGGAVGALMRYGLGLRIGLLTVSTTILVVITAASLPVSLNVLAVLLMIVASLAFLLCPAMLESTLERRRLQPETLGESSEF